MDERTQSVSMVETKPATLLIVDSRRQPMIIPLNGSMSLGRDYPEAKTHIRVKSSITGRRQGEFIFNPADGNYYYIDNNSTNGTYVNGVKLPYFNERGTRAHRLSDGDILRIDRRTLNDPHPESVLIIFSLSFSLDQKWMSAAIPPGDMTIGRGHQNALPLEDLAASRNHALLRNTPQGLLLYDCNSTNGIRVNNIPITGGVHIYDHDVFRIANTIFIVLGNTLVYNYLGERSGTLSVHIKRKTVNMGRKTLLRDIKFDADNGEFILILGGSGAGKTTLVNAILGDGKAEGEVILDGQNLYTNFKTMKSQIGLVPQFLNLRVNDKVKQTLMDIADIKLPGSSYSKEEKLKRVDAIMDKVGITNLQNHLLRQLSGGQKKKVSVAAQLVGFQKVFICDEPDSGLDAASRMQQMEILKEIADNGKIVMVISHEPDDAVDEKTRKILFTKVIVLARSSTDLCGRLAFYGSPEMALSYFGVNRLQDIMLEINPPHEGGRGRADHYIEKYINTIGGGQV